MYTKILFSICVWISSISFSFAQDSLSKGEKQVIKIFGELFNHARKEIFADMRTNGDRSVLGNALRETMGGIVKRTKTRILNGGLDNIAVQLPNALDKNKSILINKGKQNLLADFKSSLQEASKNALLNSLAQMAEQVTELDVNTLIDKADDTNLEITDLFKNMQRNKLIYIAKPFAKTAFKLSGGKKLYKKIDKEIKKANGKNLDIRNDEYIATVATDLFFDFLSNEERSIKKNPLNLLEGLFKF